MDTALTGGRLPTTSIIGAIVGSLTKSGKGMEVAALADPTTTGALNVVWTSFFTDWRSAPGVTIAPATSLEIGNEDGGDIPVIADGEPMEAGPESACDLRGGSGPMPDSGMTPRPGPAAPSFRHPFRARRIAKRSRRLRHLQAA